MITDLIKNIVQLLPHGNIWDHSCKITKGAFFCLQTEKYTLEMESSNNVRVHILVSIKWWGGVNCHSIIYSGKVMWPILMMASHLKSAYNYANSTAIPLLVQYGSWNTSEDSRVERRNIKAQDPTDETAKTKYTAIPFENKKSNVMNVL